MGTGSASHLCLYIIGKALLANIAPFVAALLHPTDLVDVLHYMKIGGVARCVSSKDEEEIKKIGSTKAARFSTLLNLQGKVNPLYGGMQRAALPLAIAYKCFLANITTYGAAPILRSTYSTYYRPTGPYFI